MEIFISNTYSILKTDNIKLLKALGKKYRCKSPGCEFATSYKRGHWDGYNYFFNPKTGKFGTGLLYSILEDLNYLEYDYELKDSRPSINVGSSDIEGVEPRDYQESLIKESLDLKSCIIKSPTGSGKTIIIAAILKALEGKTLEEENLG